MVNTHYSTTHYSFQKSSFYPTTKSLTYVRAYVQVPLQALQRFSEFNLLNLYSQVAEHVD